MKKAIRLSNQDIISRVEGNIVSDMDGEKVMLSIEKGKYYNLGELGGDVWEYIKDPIQVDTLINELLVDYEVEREECEVQVQDFINQLQHQGLVKVQCKVNR